MQAFDRSLVAAGGVNALSGVCLLAAVLAPAYHMFTPGLLILLLVLFGPLLGFILTSLFSRCAWTVGRRLGGGATLEASYRLCAWTFLPLPLAALLGSLVPLLVTEPDWLAMVLFFMPPVMVGPVALRNYVLNLVSVQGFTRKRSIACFILSLMTFLILIAGFLSMFWLLSVYLPDSQHLENLKFYFCGWSW